MESVYASALDGGRLGLHRADVSDNASLGMYSSFFSRTSLAEDGCMHFIMQSSSNNLWNQHLQRRQVQEEETVGKEEPSPSSAEVMISGGTDTSIGASNSSDVPFP